MLNVKLIKTFCHDSHVLKLSWKTKHKTKTKLVFEQYNSENLMTDIELIN